ncbi:hypothetical protein GCM10010218_13190 [Streptomyces mashuensis]|uniref:Uncharacterized protein n=1 Tax=Streptomyces mashuensis TaxID=33904 RepID=A0A919AZP5_9ACTN|nr:hypothetical protein GCM10010218_13190 [Streptomyces mashuensis]
MTVPIQPKRWVSLGVLFGGHTSYATPPPVFAPWQAPAPPPTPSPQTAEQGPAEETMLAAGYKPKVPFPGARSRPWPSECITCGASRKPSLQDVERGMRCKHIRRRSATTSR